jgi:molybdopterin synthase catalytic subunit
MKKTPLVHEKGSISLPNLIRNVKETPGFENVGGIAIFVGVVRGENLEHEKVETLTIEAYEEKANEVLENICNDLSAEADIFEVQIHHLLGEFTVGEDLVYVLVAGSHRGKIFPVLEQVIERFKNEAPIFKKESITTDSGEARAYWLSEKKKKLQNSRTSYRHQ